MITYTSFKDRPLTSISFYRNTTRFEPTSNGPLHLGHLYMILVNYHEAKSSGGKFILRVEDNSQEWLWRCGKETTQDYINGYRDDLEWLGIEPDIWLLESELEADVKEIREMLAPDWEAEKKVMYFVPWVPFDEAVTYYPYAPHLTINRVIMDCYAGVTLLIRGNDLLTEHCLYMHLCDRLGLPKPRCVYLPRLRLQSKKELLGSISKTDGGFSIARYRDEGWTPKDLLAELRKACLKDPEGDWTIRNVKLEPLWSH